MGSTLILNLAILTLLVVVKAFVLRLWVIPPRYRQIAEGIAFGLVAVGTMALPFHLTPGLIFDMRTVVISMCGLFGGGIPTLVALWCMISARSVCRQRS